MSTPLGDFIRAKRDSIQPASLGLPDRGRRRSPGLRRSDLATRAGISVEYLTRMEQGRDRNPSVAVVNALADALGLDPSERNHLRYLAKITGGECTAHAQPAPPRRDVRPTVLETLRLLEPGIAMVTNRLGDALARTSGYESRCERDDAVGGRSQCAGGSHSEELTARACRPGASPRRRVPVPFRCAGGSRRRYRGVRASPVRAARRPAIGAIGSAAHHARRVVRLVRPRSGLGAVRRWSRPPPLGAPVPRGRPRPVPPRSRVPPAVRAPQVPSRPAPCPV